MRLRFSITFRWFLALLISGIRRNRISSPSVITVGHGMNSQSEPGKMAVDLMFWCVLFIIVPSMFFVTHRPKKQWIK